MTTDDRDNWLSPESQRWSMEKFRSGIKTWSAMGTNPDPSIIVPVTTSVWVSVDQKKL